MYININTNMYTKEYTFVYTLCKDDSYYIYIYIYIHVHIYMHMYAHLCIIVYICAHNDIVYRYTQNMIL